jgi:methylated-DNA-[protein]-cysteine S-methyltransferase
MPESTGTTLVTTVDSPIGPLTLMARDGNLTHLVMEDQAHATVPPAGSERDDDAFDEVASQLDEYFAGTRTVFDVPMALEGTDFQQRVWAELCAIPYGQTISYGELARRVGNPKASRAVGLANGRNPVAVIVPCHRVIAADGSLGGYGGGLDRKVHLLGLEQRRPG